MAVVILLSVVAMMTMGFVLALLALRQVRPAWLRMRASVGKWASFSIEMDRRQEQAIDTAGDRAAVTEQPNLHDTEHLADSHVFRP